MSEKTQEAIVSCFAFIILMAFIGGMTILLAPSNKDSRIERLEQKIDAIHRVVVGSNP